MFEPQHQSTSPGSRAPPTKVHNLALAIVLILALPASATPLVGVPSVIDGDTIEIHGERIRLNGIDAPESAQLCTNASWKDVPLRSGCLPRLGGVSQGSWPDSVH
jgi:endonuclease YncB( thermonuclease family)